MTTPPTVVLLSIALLALGTFGSRAPTDPPPCPASSGGAAGMLESYQFADTTTDLGMKIWRQSIGLPVIPVSQITIVTDTAVCRRALNTYNAIVTRGSLLAARTANVLQYGSTRYIVGDPSQTAGEWMHEAVVDRSFQKIAVAGR
ncbi:MAG: hypothetical protein ABR582_16370 [Gemmatimonadaceae bacterium]